VTEGGEAVKREEKEVEIEVEVEEMHE